MFDLTQAASRDSLLLVDRITDQRKFTAPVAVKRNRAGYFRLCANTGIILTDQAPLLTYLDDIDNPRRQAPCYQAVRPRPAHSLRRALKRTYHQQTVIISADALVTTAGSVKQVDAHSTYQ